MRTPGASLYAGVLALSLLLSGCGDDGGGGGGPLRTWTNISPAGVAGTDYPTGRQFHAMAFDSDRNVVVLFGGHDGMQNLSDTWEFGGASWTDVSPSGAEGTDFPTARRMHAMAYNSLFKVTVLFGGDDNSGLTSDVWEWDGSTWTDMSPGGVEGTDFPSARAEHAMAFDSRDNVVFMFGGEDAGGYRSDIWQYSNGSWSDSSPAGTPGVDFPEARKNHAMAFDSLNNRTVLFGGYDGGLYADAWAWDTPRWQEAPYSGAPGVDFPEPRRRLAIAYDSVADTVVGFGGDQGAVRLSDTWEFDGTSWTETATAGTEGVDFPSRRHYHAMAFDSDNGVTILFGGYNGAWLDDTWEYN